VYPRFELGEISWALAARWFRYVEYRNQLGPATFGLGDWAGIKQGEEVGGYLAQPT
jgi:hypothetical protein